jgi:hypothetical protein
VGEGITVGARVAGGSRVEVAVGAGLKVDVNETVGIGVRFAMAEVGEREEGAQPVCTHTPSIVMNKRSRVLPEFFIFSHSTVSPQLLV